MEVFCMKKLEDKFNHLKQTAMQDNTNKFW